MKRILWVFSLILFLISAPSLFAAGGGGTYGYHAEFFVYDHNGAPLAGINVKLWVTTQYGDPFDPDFYDCWEYGTTNSNGQAYLSCWIPTQYADELEKMQASMLNSDYTILYSENTVSYAQTRIYPRYDLMYDTDHNLIYDPWELPLAEKFCPSLKLHSPTDWIAPEPVEYINADVTSGLWFAAINTNSQKVDDFSVDDEGLFVPPVSNWHPWINNPSSSWETLTWNAYNYEGQPPGAAYGNYYLRFHFGFSGNPDPSGWSALYQTERNNNYFSHTIYAHLFVYGSRYVIQYWIFYPYNDGYNNHEGDWEHINVVVDSQDPADAEIVKVNFYFHHLVQLRIPSDMELDNNTHPVIYVGGSCAGIDLPATCVPGETSGGSYPEPGTWSNVGPLGFDEYVWGNGPYINYSEFIDGDPNDKRGIVILPEIDDIDYSNDLHMRWFKAAIPWGLWEADSPGEWLQPFLYIWPTTGGDIGNDGPPGPPYNSGWNTLEDNNSFSYYSARP